MNALTKTITKAVAGAAVVLTALTASLAGGATPAHAAYGGNPLLDSVSALAVCDRTNRTINFHANVMLNRSGVQWVGVNFSFYEIDRFGSRVGPVYYHNGRSIATYPNGYATPVQMNTWTNTGGAIFNNAKPYYGGSVTWNPPPSNRIRVDVMVAVWNGSSWQHTNWLQVRYENSFFNGLYPESYPGSACLLRV